MKVFINTLHKTPIQISHWAIRDGETPSVEIEESGKLYILEFTKGKLKLRTRKISKANACKLPIHV